MHPLIKIPPQERYNQHVNKVDVPDHLFDKVTSQLSLSRQQCHLKKLSGGFQNANYLLESEKRKLVLRFYSTDIDTALREVGILRFLENRDVLVPRVLDFYEIENKCIAVLEFLEGESLQDQMENTQIPAQTFFLLGQELAKIHLIDLPRPGFIGPEMKIGHEYEAFGPFLKDYILQVFGSVPPSRLEPAVRDRLLKLVGDKWSVVLTAEPASHLVHCDFNPKNILVSKTADPLVTGILDWEFSISGSGYIDIGNFFRFPYDYPDYAQSQFVEGYKSLKPLSQDWKEISLLSDLGNMASFMERREDYQKTFRTARAVIDSTLNHFGY